MPVPKRIEDLHPPTKVPPKILTKNRIKYVKVYFSLMEYDKLVDLAKKEHMRLSPFIRKKSLSEYLISTHKGTIPIERITRKDIEKKMVVDQTAKDFRECMKEIKQGIKLQPVGSFDSQINFVVVEEWDEAD